MSKVLSGENTGHNLYCPVPCFPIRKPKTDLSMCPSFFFYQNKKKKKIGQDSICPIILMEKSGTDTFIKIQYRIVNKKSLIIINITG